MSLFIKARSWKARQRFCLLWESTVSRFNRLDNVLKIEYLNKLLFSWLYTLSATRHSLFSPCSSSSLLGLRPTNVLIYFSSWLSFYFKRVYINAWQNRCKWTAMIFEGRKKKKKNASLSANWFRVVKSWPDTRCALSIIIDARLRIATPIVVHLPTKDTRIRGSIVSYFRNYVPPCGDLGKLFSASLSILVSKKRHWRTSHKGENSGSSDMASSRAESNRMEWNRAK